MSGGSSTGVVTTARSTIPSRRARTAWGVEWLDTRTRMPGYRSRKAFKTGSSRHRRATSLAPMDTEPCCNSRSSVSSFWALSMCSTAGATWDSSSSPSGVRVIPRRDRRNRVQPSACSRSFMVLVTLGWLRYRALAAWVMFLQVATK